MIKLMTLSSFLIFSISPINAGENNDWLIVPGVSIGAITLKTSHNNLIEIYGMDNVKEYEVYLGEGISSPGTVLFSEIPEKRIEIVWKDETRQLPSRLQINGNHSLWKTKEGVTVGTTLLELETLNGKPFTVIVLLIPR